MGNNVQIKTKNIKNKLLESEQSLTNILKNQQQKYELKMQEATEKVQDTNTYKAIEKLSNKVNTEITKTIDNLNSSYQNTQAEITKKVNYIFDFDDTPETQGEKTTIEKTTNKNLDVYNDNTAKGFKVTTNNKTYELTASEKEILYAIVAAESDKSPDDALAVATTILNRCESPKWTWIKGDSRNPVTQATAANQFVVYQEGIYKKYMNGNAPDTVVKAVDDALAGVRNHEYLSFRSNNTTSYSSNMITSTGNRYK